MTVCALGPHSFNVGGVMYIFAVCCECGAGECGAGFSRVHAGMVYYSGIILSMTIVTKEVTWD